MTDSRTRDQIAGLFGFSEELLTLKGARRPLRRMQDLGQLCLTEPELLNLPAVVLAKGQPSEGVWLEIERLDVVPPPTLPESLQHWIEGDLLDPAAQPTVLARRVLDVPIELASDLIDGELLLPDNVHEHRQQDETVRVVLDLLHMPLFAARLSGYLEQQWAPWAQEEQPRRQNIDLYRRLFQLHTRLQSGEEADIEFIWGFGIASLKSDERWLQMPLLQQPIEIELIDDTGRLLVRPRDADLRIDMSMLEGLELPGLQHASEDLEHRLAEWQARVEQSEEGALAESGLLPGETSTWVPFLETLANRLSAEARVIARDEGDMPERWPGAQEHLAIVASWALFDRPRSRDYLLRNLRDFRQMVEAVDSNRQLSAPLAGLAASVAHPGADRRPDSPETELPGFEDTVELTDAEQSAAVAFDERDAIVLAATAKDCRRLFPLASNEEQLAILDALHDSPVVPVTGPPGTGKTHTIANIVAHCMASGMSVLVTAPTAEAIVAVREKLPADLAELVVAAVGSDRDSNRQAEATLLRLGERVQALREDDLEREVQRLQGRLLHLESVMEAADEALSRLALANLEGFEYQGSTLSLMDLADALDAEESQHDWFLDRPLQTCPADLESQLEGLRQSLQAVADDSPWIGLELPSADDLPDSKALIAGHQELHREREPALDPARFPMIAIDDADDWQRATTLLESLRATEQSLADWPPWARRTLAVLFTQERESPLEKMVLALSRWQQPLGVSSLAQLGDLGSVEPDSLFGAVDRASRGKHALTLWQRLSNRALGSAVRQLRVNGAAPSSTEHWQEARRALHFRLKLRPLLEKSWPTVCQHLHVAELPVDDTQAHAAAVNRAQQAQRVLSTLSRLRESCVSLEALFPVGWRPSDMDISTTIAPLWQPLKAHVDARTATFQGVDPQAGMTVAEKTDHVGRRLQRELEPATGAPLVDMLDELSARLADSQTSPETLIALRTDITGELRRLELGQPARAAAAEQLEWLADAGAPLLAEGLRLGAQEAKLLESPSQCRDAWEWGRGQASIARVASLGNGDEFHRQRHQAADDRQRVIETLIREKTLLGLKRRVDARVQSALVRFGNAMRQFGKGTGKSAARWQREMKLAAKDALDAVPVWIMPEYRIAEQMEASVGRFDLVILDEASQCDVTAIALLARGRRCLVVGDEKQVSPAGVGISIEQVDALRARYLGGLSHADSIDHKTSIFTLVQQQFSQSSLMLREHFRSVEAIISFSSRFYENRLVPLRIPKPSERIDPPLVDIHIEDATENDRQGKVNPLEVRAIVDEIIRLHHSGDFEGRSIAVVSLLGKEQAEAVERAILDHAALGPGAISAHRILCGDSRTLQGQERDIVFLTLVATPDTVRSQSSEDFVQRVNVAMSRARDRLYLVRSFASRDLKTGDLKQDILAHFVNPDIDTGAVDRKQILQRCESGFERDVCERLLAANYRVDSQVRAGPFRIDLVVEGEGDRRLAIELDGDHWHGPEHWARDRARQASLERAGWVFWRVFGSQWWSNRALQWQNLLSTLEAMYIAPIGEFERFEVFSERRSLQRESLLEPSERAELVALAGSANLSDKAGDDVVI